MNILIIRPLEQGLTTQTLLEKAGHKADCSPFLEVVPVTFAWPTIPWNAVILTSQNTLPALKSYPSKAPKRAHVVGEKTALLLTQQDEAWQIVTQETTAQDLLTHLVTLSPPQTLLYLRGETIRHPMGEPLRKARHTLLETICYQTLPQLSQSDLVSDALRKQRYDWVLLYSAQTAAAFASFIRTQHLEQETSALKIAALSPAVADCLRGVDCGNIYIAKKPDESHLLTLLGVAV